jgi:hypothetical protein
MQYQRERMIENGTESLHDINFVDPAEGMELSYQEILKVYDLMDENPDRQGIPRLAGLPDFTG